MTGTLSKAMRWLSRAAPLVLTASLGAQTALTTVRSVRDLSPERAKASLPVELHGVVTTLSGWKNSFFFDDGTAGISIDRLTTSPSTAQGEVVTIHGHTSAGLFAPIVIADSLQVEGHHSLETPRVYAAAELIGGSRDSQWVAVRGIVRTAQVKPLWGTPRLTLSVDIGDGTLISAVVQDSDPGLVSRLPSSTVLLRGVCGTVFNDRRQYVGLRLFVSGARDIVVEKAAPQQPFDLPERSLSAIMQFRDGGDRATQVKVRGNVTWSRPGVGVYIQAQDQGLFVRSGMEDTVAVGSDVEAVGYPSQGTYAPQLENAILHVVSESAAMPPISAAASGMIVDRDGFPAVPYDSMLVQTRGKLLEQFPRGEDRVLLLQDGNTVFSARLSSAAMGKTRFDIGSLLAITGICQVNVGESREPRAFTLLMRSREDIAVLKAAPWWTTRHASWTAGGLLLVSLLMSGCIAVLRREARLRALVVEDQLTGLYNRRGFLAFAQDRWQVARRQGSPLLLFYIDLDDFKRINDSFGHKSGDQALRAVSSVLHDCFRRTDVIGRLGGDEFAIAAIDATESVRATLEERLQASLAQLNGKARLPFAVHLSIGLLWCDPRQEDGTIEDLLARADQRMYEQKRKRRSVPTPDRGIDLAPALSR